MTTDLPLLPPAEALRAAKRAFLSRFDAFCAATGRKPGGVSDALFGSSKKVRQLRDPENPKDVNVEVLAEADATLARLAAEAGITLPVTAPDTNRAPTDGENLSKGARHV